MFAVMHFYGMGERIIKEGLRTSYCGPLVRI